MLETLLTIILAPLAVAAAGATLIFIYAFIKGFAEYFKRRKR